ncbi:hypothetical protein [Flagellimonas meishanensis]|uniref:hypothetical protein n=1 Tax=Flagellimonas meishanensis TaxID=2873264 RepID=UPI001CA6B104|nr:hypothetical protein [[Muricauda] meishanensis]
MKLDNKNKLLAGVFFMLLFLSYPLAFKKTMALREEYTTNADKQQLAAHVPQELSMMTQKEKYLDAQFKAFNLGTSSLQNDLLKFLNEITVTRNVKIIEFKSPHRFWEKDSQVKTYIFSLEGGFMDILKVLHALEEQAGFGTISHAAFEKKKDHRRGKSHLQVLVFLEHVE